MKLVIYPQTLILCVNLPADTVGFPGRAPSPPPGHRGKREGGWAVNNALWPRVPGTPGGSTAGCSHFKPLLILRERFRLIQSYNAKPLGKRAATPDANLKLRTRLRRATPLGLAGATPGPGRQPRTKGPRIRILVKGMHLGFGFDPQP